MVQNIINPLMLTFVTDKLCDDLLFTQKTRCIEKHTKFGKDLEG